MNPRFRSVLFAVAALFAATLFAQSPAASAPDPLSKIPELPLSDGRILKNATISGFTSETVVVRHASGSTLLRYEFLPDEQRAAAEKKRPGGARWFGRKSGAPTAPSADSLTIRGQVFITTAGAGAYKFSGITVHAFPASAIGAWEATYINPVVVPRPLSSATTDGDGRFVLEVPRRGGYLLWAQASRMYSDGAWGRYEWRVPSTDITSPDNLIMSDKWRFEPRNIKFD